MYEDVISARASDDQEEVARKIQKYDLLAIPVLDDDQRLVGIITTMMPWIFCNKNNRKMWKN